ncbi:MAG: Holliday junction resolvase RuvX [Patescibacteria group bacterium]
MRYLGIDYGLRRIGMAVADAETGVAVPRGVIVRAGDAEAIGKIKALVIKERIEKIVVGAPLGLDGVDTEISRAARAFGENLGVASGVPVEFENEMLTTRMATNAGVRKEDVDASAAAIILQSYLDKIQMPKSK